MSKTYKREMKKARNLEAMNMILHCKGGAMKDKREKRLNNPKRKDMDYNAD